MKVQPGGRSINSENIWVGTSRALSPGQRPAVDRSPSEKKDLFMAKPKLKQHLINRAWCKGCGICVQFCPKNVLELDDADKVVAARPEDCICCRLCELRCPDFAIEIETEET
jgi:2-oxoglutarate ferredoxin oxidoreductase subunit delta